MKLRFALTAAAAILLGSLPALADDGDVQPVHYFGTSTIVAGGWSSLTREHNGIAMTFHATQLPAGTANTIWWIIFNQPENCAAGGALRCGIADLSNPATKPSVGYAAGQVAGADGTADYSASLTVGNTAGFLFGPGITNPDGADVHLAVRTHGLASSDPAVLLSQLSSFNGGCPPNVCQNIQMSAHESD